MTNVLVISFTRMGDLIQSGPLLRAIKHAREDARITLIVFDLFRDAARRLPMVDKVISFDVDQWVSLLDAQRGSISNAYTQAQDWLQDNGLSHCDLAVNLSHTKQSAMLCGMIEANEIVGLYRKPNGRLAVSGEWFNYLFSIMQDRTRNPFNLVEIYRRFYGRNSCGARLEFEVHPSDRESAMRLLSAHNLVPSQPYVVLQAGASSPSRQWPTGKFAELARRLSNSGRQVVLSGSQGEAQILEEVVGMSERHAASLAGETSLGVLAAILEGAEKLISNDTGTIHLAAAVGTPTVGIYIGPASAKDTAPYGNGHLIVEADLSCAPCGYHDRCACPTCAKQITVEHIFSLAMTTANESHEVAGNMQGIRVYRTQVGHDGQFSLILLNSCSTGMRTEHRDYYRNFWDTLLAPDNGDSRTEEVKPAHLPSLEPAGLFELQHLLGSAQHAFLQLNLQHRRGPRDAKALSDMLRIQAQWQNDLHPFMNKFPQLSPFIRYLLVKLSMVDSDNLEYYLSDMAGILSAFEQGVKLMDPNQRDKNSIKKADVCAA